MSSRIYVTPPFDIKSVSPVVALGATDQLTITHEVMTVEGNGGAIVSTATPFFDTAFEVDGFVIWVFGNNNINTLSLQDYRNLVGTKLAMDGGIDATLGEDDYIAYMFRVGSGRWVELTRSNN